MKTKLVSNTLWLAGASLIIVFMLDTITPAKYVIDILYLCCILFVFKEKTSTIRLFGTAAGLLIVFNAMVEHNEKFSDAIWINRGISLLAILITSYIALHYRKVNKKAQMIQQQQLKSFEEMLFILSHKVRRPLTSILGVIEIIKEDGPDISSQDLKTRCQYLLSSANELDVFVKELNAFMHKAEKQTQE